LSDIQIEKQYCLKKKAKRRLSIKQNKKEYKQKRTENEGSLSSLLQVQHLRGKMPEVICLAMAQRDIVACGDSDIIFAFLTSIARSAYH